MHQIHLALPYAIPVIIVLMLLAQAMKVRSNREAQINRRLAAFAIYQPPRQYTHPLAIWTIVVAAGLLIGSAMMIALMVIVPVITLY
jgi:hypothetical protein